MKELELYIHIPFCVKKCSYCDFLSWSARPEEREAYVQALIREIESYKKIAKNYQIPTAFIGGGTPSILEENQMERIVEALRDTFSIKKDAEITMEVNPGMIQSKNWNPFINRISFGLQSTHNEELKILGRIHTYEEFLDSYNQARAAGCQNINIDLISSIPGQSTKSWEENLTRIIELFPEHISAYSLIIEEGTPFYQLYGQANPSRTDLPTLPTEEDEALMYEQTQTILHQAGYERYEVSNYAKPGRECRHNLGYWKRREYLGLGLGAASLMDHQRFSNTTSMKTYLHQNRTTSAEYENLNARLQTLELSDHQHLTKTEEMEEFMFLGLRMTKGISKTKFQEYFHQNIHTIYGETIKKYANLNLLKDQADRIFLTDRGLEVSNQILSEFL